jgi:hypothetical protein
MSMLFGTSGIGHQLTFSVVPFGQCPDVTWYERDYPHILKTFEMGIECTQPVLTATNIHYQIGKRFPRLPLPTPRPTTILIRIGHCTTH